MIKVSIENAQRMLPISGAQYIFNTTKQSSKTALELSRLCLGMAMTFDAMRIYRTPDQVCFKSDNAQMTVNNVKFFEIDKQESGDIRSFNIVCADRIDKNRLLKYSVLVQ